MSAITHISIFHIAVNDMDVSKKFYTHVLGFELTREGGQGNARWASLTLPNEKTSIALTNITENMKPGTIKLWLTTSDVQATYKSLQEKGAHITSDIHDEQWSKWFSLEDPDGNHLYIGQ